VLGLVLVVAFVPWALSGRNRHPLVDLRLFGNRNLTVAVIAMSLFAMAFFGASLLFPLYFQEVRSETALHAGLLLAPQGVGAMLTMPAAGILADRIGPGKIVLAGIVVITVGMAMFTQVDADTSYAFLLGSLFVMGLGMGGTMMPIMTSALQTLREHTIARGSTLMNIVQQVAASMGTALFSVLLTNGLTGKESLQVAQVADDPSRLTGVLQRLGVAPDRVPALLAQVPGDMADAFANVFVVATVLVALCLVPALFLPRRRPERAVDPAALMGH
jgi:EmrB/QacA subfamily drug resistance transporter